VDHVVAEPPRPEASVERVGHAERMGVLAPLSAITGKRPPRGERPDSD
jgi:hypothetical protein